MPDPTMRRRPLRRLALAMATAALLSPGAAFACRCARLGPTAHAKYADAIVLGEIVGMQEGARSRRYDLRVSRSWKQRLIGPVTISSDRTSCMVDLPKAGRHLIYLSRRDGGYQTTMCSGNVTAEKAGPAIGAIRGKAYR